MMNSKICSVTVILNLNMYTGIYFITLVQGERDEQKSMEDGC